MNPFLPCLRHAARLATVASLLVGLGVNAAGCGPHDRFTSERGGPAELAPSEAHVLATASADDQSATASGFYTLTPCRLVDTRNVAGAYGWPPLAAGTDRVFLLAGQCGIPATATAVSANVTITQTGFAGHLTLYSAGSPLPSTSSINYGPNMTRANNAIVPPNLVVRCAQASGTTHFILDVNGYFQ